jgi:hypothetical protein
MLRGYVEPDDGYTARVLRILAAAALLAVVVTGCGSAARPERAASRGLPRALARGWERQAAAIAAAAALGNDCRAQRLAISLRDDVVQSQNRLPLRLRSPLRVGVNSLAERTACTPVATTTPPPKESQPPHKGPEPKPPKPPKKHGPHGHDKGDHGGHDG